MTWEIGSTDQQRLRAGFVVLAIGAAILLATWGVAVMRGPQTQGEQAVRHQKLEPPAGDQLLPAKMATGMLLYGAALFVVFIVSVVALVRISRRYRERLFRPQSKPTRTSDVWRMHKVPDLEDNEAGRDART